MDGLTNYLFHLTKHIVHLDANRAPNPPCKRLRKGRSQQFRWYLRQPGVPISSLPWHRFSPRSSRLNDINELLNQIGNLGVSFSFCFHVLFRIRHDGLQH